MNKDRLDVLRFFLHEGQTDNFNKLLYEWVKTGVFTSDDLNQALALLYDYAYNEGESSSVKD